MSWSTRVIALASRLPDRYAFPILLPHFPPPDFDTIGVPGFRDLRRILTFPFSEEDAPNISVTEGWIYGQRERSLHGNIFHGSTDLTGTYGTPIRAAVSGWTIFYRWTQEPVQDHRGKTVMVAGRPLRRGGGLTVQTALSNGLFVRYCHLASLGPDMDPKLIRTRIVREGRDQFHYDPVGHNWTYNQVRQNGAVWIDRGQIIGYMGWDNCQYLGWPELHFEVFARPDPNGGPICIDPGGSYRPAPDCLNPQFFGRFSPNLWAMSPNGQIAFAA